MISKIENLIEIKKIKSLNEIILDDNPVLVLSEALEIMKTLPINNLDKDKFNKKVFNSNSSTSSTSVNSYKNKQSNESKNKL